MIAQWICSSAPCRSKTRVIMLCSRHFIQRTFISMRLRRRYWRHRRQITGPGYLTARRISSHGRGSRSRWLPRFGILARRSMGMTATGSRKCPKASAARSHNRPAARYESSARRATARPAPISTGGNRVPATRVNGRDGSPTGHISSKARIRPSRTIRVLSGRS